MTTPRLKSLLSLFAIALVGVVLAGCGEEAQHLEAKEGGRIQLDELYYQVQLSRQLNPKDVEDSYYLEGYPLPAKGESYFGVFVRVDNETSSTRKLPIGTEHMKIVAANGDEFEPLKVNAPGWGYEPAPLGKGAMLPIPDTPAFVGTIRGSLILFRIPNKGLDDRPLKLEIEHGDEVGEITLDV